MVDIGSIRNDNKDRFKRCIELRKQGLSYREIRKIVSIPKSTLQNWLTISGLTLTKDHVEIQLRKRVENKHVANEASRITRKLRYDKEIEEFVNKYNEFTEDPIFIAGMMLFLAEGSKSQNCKFSNSDPRIIQFFVKFAEKYLFADRNKNLKFRLYIHSSRSSDLKRIISFWSGALNIPENSISISWKNNTIVRRRENADYIGLIMVSFVKIPLITKKLVALSNKILENYCRVV